ncbi:MAG: hypothetical protein LBD23_18955 [Oscillospiraceae bacterium]|jgi:hypothetical protein|nr:hypothetical protein [Oscillospiraceae bacterium]
MSEKTSIELTDAIEKCNKIMKDIKNSINENDKFYKKVESKQNNFFYDPDSSPAAWEHYLKYYTKSRCENHWKLIEEFLLVNNCLSTSTDNLRLNGTRLLAVMRDVNGTLCPEFELGGDCDFNFNWIKYNKFANFFYNEFYCEKKKEWNDFNVYCDCIKILNLCNKMHHTLLNFSIMPVTGGMNNRKNNLPGSGVGGWLDRLDRFIYFLDSYYKEEKDGEIFLIENNNKKHLEDFLKTFKNGINGYCKVIYFIEDSTFVKELIESGKNPLRTAKNVLDYMYLAMKYWKLKRSMFV